jgi:hypothetical protein
MCLLLLKINWSAGACVPSCRVWCPCISAGVRAAGRLQFWDLERFETFLYLYAFGSGAWLALLSDGRFDGSPDALRYLCYTERGSFNSYTAEELVSQFHAPQAIRDVMARYHVPLATP